MDDIDGHAHSLQAIAKAAQVIAGQVSSEGVATALLNVCLDMSGAGRGAAVLADKGELALGEDGFAPGLPLVAKLKPQGELTELPLDLLRAVVDTRTPQVRAIEQPGFTRTTLCTPIASRDVLKGFVYLEFDDARRQATSDVAAAVTLLASHAAMTLDALGDFGSQAETSIWRSRSRSPSSVATFRWNPATRLATGSPEYYEMLGFDPEGGPIDFVSMTSRVHPADYPMAQAIVDDVVRRRSPLKLEFRIVLPSGQIRNLLLSGQFDLADIDQPELGGVVMDVTSLRAADDLLRAAHEDADRQLRLVWLGEIAGSIIHEVNQPLGVILSSADAARRWLDRDKPDVDAAMRSIERIAETAAKAGRTVADMRSLTSSVSTELVDKPMSSILSEALQMCSVMIGRMDIRTEIAFDQERPTVSVNTSQMLQVMLNLLHNAVESMRDVIDRPRTLTLRTGREGDFVVAEIADTGVGLSGAHADLLFDPMYTTKKDGMGLGLSICRRVVLAHGGTVFAKPNDGFGATFVVRLPSAGALADAAAKSD